MDIVYGILLDNGAGYNAKCDASLALRIGDFCIIRKDFYLDYGQIVKQFDTPPDTAAPAPQPPHDDSLPDSSGISFNNKKNEIQLIQRKATVVDQGKAHENQMRAKSALRITLQYVERLNLPMKLINAHYSFDGKLITIQFSAEGRVDFRELVKLLSQEFNTHIELRQIGVRDETSILGGIANCGRPLCCCQFLTEFASINVKMAKEQDLSLTPSTISGICGRLKCCLKYEHDGYLQLEKTMPRRGDLCECKDGRGRVIDRNLLTQKVTVLLDDSTHSVVCPASEVSVIYLDKYKIRNNAGGSASPQTASAATQSAGANAAQNAAAPAGVPAAPPQPQKKTPPPPRQNPAPVKPSSPRSSSPQTPRPQSPRSSSPQTPRPQTPRPQMPRPQQGASTQSPRPFPPRQPQSAPPPVKPPVSPSNSFDEDGFADEVFPDDPNNPSRNNANRRRHKNHRPRRPQE